MKVLLIFAHQYSVLLRALFCVKVNGLCVNSVILPVLSMLGLLSSSMMPFGWLVHFSVYALSVSNSNTETTLPYVFQTIQQLGNEDQVYHRMCSASIVKKYIFTFALLAFRTTVTVIDTLADSLWVAASRSLLDCASCCLVNSTRKRRMKLAYAIKQPMDENLCSSSTAMLSSAHKTLKRIYGLKIVDIKNLKRNL